MTHKFNRQEAQATRQIKRNGFPILLIRPGQVDDAAYPPTKGADTGFQFNAVQTRLTFGDMQSENVQTGDVRFIMATGDTEPLGSDKIKANGVRYDIVSVDRVAPAGVPLMWKVIARGGVADTSTYIAGSPLLQGGVGGEALLYPYTLGVPDLIDEGGPTYFYWGWEDVEGDWLIKEINVADSMQREAGASTDPQYADLAAAWPNRTNLSFA